MKAQLRLPQKSLFGLVMILMFTVCSFNTVQAQEVQGARTVKGVVTDANGPLESASVILKGTKTGTVTNAKGEFTFPQALKVGDVLVISYLGYETVTIKIEKTTTNVTVQLNEEMVEFVGELNSNKPYKSKRPKNSK